MRFATDVLKQMAIDSQDGSMRHYQNLKNREPGIGIDVDQIKYDRDATDPAIIIDGRGVPILMENLKKEFILNDPSSGVT